jgi:hypothetical protein
MKILEDYTFYNPVTEAEQTQKRVVTLGANGERIDEEDFNGCDAETWLDWNGYTSLRLLALLDLEGKLTTSGKTSPKLQAVRAWINGILASFIANPAPRSDWDLPPHSFEETTTEAFALLV